ncbi:MAG: hypothetical protein KIT14_24640 [bacterium]|nr:hypothetical protein [bacterium]
MRTRLRETLHFPDLTERLTLRLSAVPRYTARSHFAPWHRILGAPDFAGMTGVFTPLTYVEIAVDDVPCDLGGRLAVRGESGLARVLGADGAVRHLVRDGLHALHRADGTRVARGRYVNTFTRYDPDPARRRVATLPASLGLGPSPSRTTTAPTLGDLLVEARPPDARDAEPQVWHLGQTDANRHVNGVAYLRVLEAFAAAVLFARGDDLRRRWAASARIVYRKPCFRGEAYRRVAWVRPGEPCVVAAAIVKEDDGPAARPAVVVELTMPTHDAAAD